MELEELDAMQEWLSQYSKETQRGYRMFFKKFLEWAKTTPEELIETYEKAEDKNKWSKEYGRILVRFQNYLLEEGEINPNSVVTAVYSVRSFFSRMCQPVKIRRGGIMTQQITKGEHVFSQSDLQKIYHIADLRDKAIISTAVSLGWGVGDFLSLERDFIEKLVERAKAENLEFIRFDWERKKTKALIMGVLTPESLKDIEKWLKYSERYDSKWLWSGGRNKRILKDTLGDILNRLSEKADLTLTGKLRFHLFRKFLMNTLSVNGLNQFEVKIILGKKIPITDLTYLQTLKESAFEKYKKAYPKFSLSTIQNERARRWQETVDAMELEIRTLKTRLERALDKCEELDQFNKRLLEQLEGTEETPKRLRSFASHELRVRKYEEE